jgi:hypothetical protein
VHFEGAQIALGLVVVEGDGEVLEEGQDRLVTESEPFAQIARWGLPEPPALARAPRRRGMGRQSSREQGMVARAEGAAVGDGQRGGAAGARPLDGLPAGAP